MEKELIILDEVYEKIHHSDVLRIKKLLLDILLYKKIKPRNKWQETVRWNGTEYVSNLKEYEGNIFLLKSRRTRRRPKIYLKKNLSKK